MSDPVSIFTLSAHTGPRAHLPRDSRTFGWFATEDRARLAASRNEGGLDECLYAWLCLERVFAGIHGRGVVMQWYAWDQAPGREGRWVEAAAPDWARQAVNFSMG